MFIWPPGLSASPKLNNTTRGAGDSQLDTALLVAEGLIGEQAQPEFLGVESERAILVCDGNAGKFDAFDHGSSTM
jgi:hypothetical protein